MTWRETLTFLFFQLCAWTGRANPIGTYKYRGYTCLPEERIPLNFVAVLTGELEMNSSKSDPDVYEEWGK